jgi:hypothetical protein
VLTDAEVQAAGAYEVLYLVGLVIILLAPAIIGLF